MIATQIVRGFDSAGGHNEGRPHVIAARNGSGAMLTLCGRAMLYTQVVSHWDTLNAKPLLARKFASQGNLCGHCARNL